MDKRTIDNLKQWAKEYNSSDFIPVDPISFPHRFRDKKDIEISAFLTAWLAYGNRKQILKKAEELHTAMEWQPLNFILQKKYKQYANNHKSFYRFFKYNDLFNICDRLNHIYTKYQDLEEATKSQNTEPIMALQQMFDGINGIPYTQQSACKRIAMFLRWMVRNDKIVDFGIWKSFSPSELLIPLDTHVFKMAKRMEMTKRSCADKKAAEEITKALKQIWPDDPCIGDFALFGCGVNENKE